MELAWFSETNIFAFFLHFSPERGMNRSLFVAKITCGRIRQETAMQKVRNALEKWDQIRLGRHGTFIADVSVRQWLAGPVCAAIEELMRHDGFREKGEWSLTHLTPNACSAERRLVERVKLAMLAHIDSLNLMNAPDWGDGTWRDATSPYSMRYVLREPYPQHLRALAPLAERCWKDLVNPKDFLQHGGDLNLAHPPCLSTDPLSAIHLENEISELDSLGDNVVAMLLKRVDFWQRFFDYASVQQSRFRSCFSARPKDFERMLRSREELRVAAYALRLALLDSPGAKERDACASLLRVHLDYAKNAQVDCHASGRKISRQQSFKGAGSARVLLHSANGVSEALVLAADLHRNPPTPMERARRASYSHKLCICQSIGGRYLFWEGKLVDVPWEKYPLVWDLLWLLAQKGKHGAAVDLDDLGEVDPHTVVCRKSRLCRLLREVSLADHIANCGRGTYRLVQLSPADIYLIDVCDLEMAIPPSRHR